MQNSTVSDDFIVLETECLLYLLILSEAQKNAYLYLT